MINLAKLSDLGAGKNIKKKWGKHQMEKIDNILLKRIGGTKSSYSMLIEKD